MDWTMRKRLCESDPTHARLTTQKRAKGYNMAAMKRQRCIRRSTIDVLTALGFVAALATGIDVFGQIGGAPVGPIPPGEYPSEPRYLKPGLWEMHLTGAWVDRRLVASA